MFYYLTERGLNETSALFCLEGPDANTYLQGQFTQELNRPSGTVAYGLFLNQKGKVVADAHIFRLGDNQFWLVCHSLPAPKLRERLEAYLIADEVTIEDVTGAWSRISVVGDEALGAVAKLFGVAPEPGIWREAGGVRVFRGRRCAEDNFELLVPCAAVHGITRELNGLGAREIDAGSMERLRIVGGIPAIPADIGLADLPNEGGLDEAAISYTKGCYLGQEVMARLKNLGQVRRRLHIVGGEGEIPTVGAPLYQGERRMGDIRSVAHDGNGFIAMAMLSLVNLDDAAALALSPNAPGSVRIKRRV